MASLPAPLPADPAGGEAMSEEELATLLAAHEHKAVGYYNSEIAAEQEQAINYYYGKMDDLPRLEGCSGVVEHMVQTQVDNALASILKPFVSADEVVSFEPRGPEDVDQAEQATEYVNYIINCDNPGFQILHDWFKDALLTKLGVVKVWWEDTPRESVAEVPADAMGLEQARKDENYLGEAEVEPGVYSVKMRQVEEDGRVRVENVPPEEFLISPYARSVDGATYVAHRPSNYTRSDLIEMGMDAEIVADLPAYASGANDDPRTQARYGDEDWSSSDRGESIADKSRDIVGVLDEYARVDFDGDGVAELRRIIRVNDIILFNEPVDEVPFATLCPVPMPHKVYGRSLADLAIEGQRVATAVTRATLDNLYKHNNPRPIIGERAYTDTTADDLGSSAPGAEIRVADTGQIDWLVVPFAADKSFGMLEYIHQGVEERTGVQRKGNGFNAEALRKNSADTATQASIDENSRNERAEMVARVFAETGVKRLFKLILGLVHKHQPRARVIRLRNQWVEIDPKGWNPEMDLAISVGLGMGNKSEQLTQAGSLLEFYQGLQASPFGYLVGPEHVHNAAKRLFTALGIKNTDDFLGDPAQMQPPEPQPDPDMAKAQAALQIEQAKMQAKMQTDAASMQLEQAKAGQKAQLEQMQAMTKLQQEQAKLEAQSQLAQAKAQFEAQLAQTKMAFEQQMAERQLAMDAQLQAARVSSDHEVKMSKNRSGGDLSK